MKIIRDEIYNVWIFVPLSLDEKETISALPQLLTYGEKIPYFFRHNDILHFGLIGVKNDILNLEGSTYKDKEQVMSIRNKCFHGEDYIIYIKNKKVRGHNAAVFTKEICFKCHAHLITARECYWKLCSQCVSYSNIDYDESEEKKSYNFS